MQTLLPISGLQSGPAGKAWCGSNCVVQVCRERGRDKRIGNQRHTEENRWSSGNKSIQTFTEQDLTRENMKVKELHLNSKSTAHWRLGFTCEYFSHTLVQRRCTDVWGWSGRTYWALWPQAEALSLWVTPKPSSSLCTHPHTAWLCPPLKGGWDRNRAPPWSTSPGNEAHVIH